MTSWFDRGRPAIFEALTNICDVIDADLREEVGRREIQAQNAETNYKAILDSKLAIIDKLEKENKELRDQISTLSAAAKDTSSTPRHHAHRETHGKQSTPSLSARPSSSTPSASDYTGVVTEDPVRLQLKFNVLSDNFKRAKAALEKRKEERDQWFRYGTILEKKLRSAEEKHGIVILDQSRRGPRPSPKPGVERSFTESVVDTEQVVNAEPVIDNEPVDAEEPELPPWKTTPTTAEQQEDNLATTQLGSTQSDTEERLDDLPPLTASDGHGEQHIKPEPSSDGSMFVSERLVRKRKYDSTAPNVAETPRIKTEPQDESSPVAILERYGINIPDSIDLDEIAQRMSTPRKRRALEELHRQEQSLAQPTLVKAPALLFVRPDNTPQPSRSVQNTSVLGSISGNRKMLRPAENKENATPHKDWSGYGISGLAEDGADYGKDISKAKGRGLNPLGSVGNSKLDSLLNSPASQVTTTISRPTKALRTPRDKLPIPQRRELPFEQSAQQQQQQQRKQQRTEATLTPWLKTARDRTSLGREKSPQRNTDGKATPLRRRPRSELRLDDFKVNPLANEGHDFAYSDVVRDKDERACLKGCTDMHCCGKEFRSLALSQRPNPPLTPAQRLEEQTLLEAYLGDYSYRLATMTREERMELWLEAKTEELANKYGKHRHRYSRMRSPPGFWNADFPDTQELESDKIEASKREQRVIADRYREATRPGGRWIFRDE